MTFWTMFFILLAARAFDLYLTSLITPDLRYEVNPLMRFLGWRWTIALNLLVCVFAAHYLPFFCILGGLSILAIIWNLRVLSRI